MQKKEIKFNKSMGLDKRNEELSYLKIGNADVGTAGMYPARDFLPETNSELLDNDQVLGIAGSENGGAANVGPFIFVDRGGSLYLFRRTGVQTGHTPMAGADVRAITNGNDGVYFVNDDDDKVYRPNYQNSNIVEVGVFPSSPQVEIGCFDGLYYWWIGNKIWRQLSDETPELIMSNSGLGQHDIRFAIPYKEWIVIFARERGTFSNQNIENSIVYFYDKKNATFFYKRINLEHKTILSAGNVNGTLFMVCSEAGQQNNNELIGKIVVYYYNGEKFVEANSIRAGRRNVTIPSNDSLPGFSSSYDSSKLIFCVDDNDRTETSGIAKNFIYQVNQDGSIEAVTEPVSIGSVNYANILFLGTNFITYIRPEIDSNAPAIFTRELPVGPPDYRDYTSYRNAKTYITNFYGNPMNEHRLCALNVSFEKMFRADGFANPPVPGSSGAITVNNVLNTEAQANWAKATDEITPQEELEYRVYISDTNNIGSLSEIELNGQLKMDWTKDVAFYNMTGLDPLTTYWVNVVVRDAAEKQAIYQQTSFTTNNYVISDWENPSAFTNITDIFGIPISGTAQNWTNPANAYSSNDTYATVNQGDAGYQQYSSFGFNIPTGATIVGFQARVEAKCTQGTGENNTVVRLRLGKDATVTDINSSNWFTGHLTRDFPATDVLTADDETYFNGGAGDLWGTANTGITPAEVNSNDFGVLLSANRQSSPTTTNYSVDEIAVRVIYEE